MPLRRGIYPVGGPLGGLQLGKDAPCSPSEFLAGTPAEPKITCPESISFLSLCWASGAASQVRSTRTSSKTGVTSLKLVIHHRNKVIQVSQSLSPPASLALCTNIQAVA